MYSGDGETWTDDFSVATSHDSTAAAHSVNAIHAPSASTKPLTEASQHLNKLWRSEYLHLSPGLHTSLCEGGGEELMERPQAVLKKQLVGMVEADAQGKVRLNRSTLKEKTDINKVHVH